MNFDRAVFREENSAGVGVIIRDSDGQIIASIVEKVPLPNSVAALEAVAAVKTRDLEFQASNSICMKIQ